MGAYMLNEMTCGLSRVEGQPNDCMKWQLLAYILSGREFNNLAIACSLPLNARRRVRYTYYHSFYMRRRHRGPCYSSTLYYVYLKLKHFHRTCLAFV